MEKVTFYKVEGLKISVTNHAPIPDADSREKTCGGKPYCCEGRRCDMLTLKESFETSFVEILNPIRAEQNWIAILEPIYKVMNKDGIYPSTGMSFYKEGNFAVMYLTEPVPETPTEVTKSKVISSPLPERSATYFDSLRKLKLRIESIRMTRDSKLGKRDWAEHDRRLALAEEILGWFEHVLGSTEKSDFKKLARQFVAAHVRAGKGIIGEKIYEEMLPGIVDHTERAANFFFDLGVQSKNEEMAMMEQLFLSRGGEELEIIQSKEKENQSHQSIVTGFKSVLKEKVNGFIPEPDSKGEKNVDMVYIKQLNELTAKVKELESEKNHWWKKYLDLKNSIA